MAFCGCVSAGDRRSVSRIKRLEDVLGVLASREQARREALSRIVQPVVPRLEIPALNIPLISNEMLSSLDVGKQIATTLERLGVFASIAASQQQIVERLASAADSPMLELSRSFAQRGTVIAEAFEAAEAVRSRYLGQLGELLLRPTIPEVFGVRRFGETFVDYLRDLSPVEWRVAAELAKRGWWLVPTWSSRFILGVLAERERRKCPVGTLLTQRYRAHSCRELARVVRGWTLREFRRDRRSSLFQRTLKQHRRREFQGVILSLVPQIEGILKDFLLAEGLCTEADFKGATTPELFTRHVSAARGPTVGGFAQQLELTYSHFQWIAPASGRRLRRHPQAHGREVPRNSEQQALRVWLMLETLHFHLERVRKARQQTAP